MKAKRREILIISLILAGMVLFCGGCSLLNYKYVDSYALEVGLPSDKMMYDEVIETLGEPINISWQEEEYVSFMSMEYPDIIFKLGSSAERSKDSSSFQVTSMNIIGDRYKLGKGKITIGSTREEVVRAYFGVKRVNGYGLGDAYKEGITYIYFNYDYSDIVTSIKIVANGP